MKIILMSLVILLATHLVYAEDPKIEEVVGAVTLKLTNGETVRLMGVQIPEDEEMKQKATECVKMLNIEGKEVRLEFDDQKEDKLFAYVYVKNTAHYDLDSPEQTWLPPQAPDPRIWNIADTWEMFLNAYIIQRGYAIPTTGLQSAPYADLFEELYQEAKEDNRGLWKEENQKKDGVHREHIGEGQWIDWHYQNGEKNGVAKAYIDNGVLFQEAYYKNDKIDGVVRTYYPEGQIGLEEHINTDKRVGPVKAYDEDGGLSREEEYNENGEKDGVVKFYHSDGRLNYAIEYENGMEIQRIYYDEAGNIRPSENMLGGR